eukprot:GHVQ01006862.1.p1 GENE.GHVQ01006862.1~~GHVQ01006862.1.p1  ORF type:complete len:550 (+),score=70.50 GHVQ01006862.1:66-1652(+)
MNDIAKCTGTHSQQTKRDLISKLLVSAKRSEPKYIVRFLQQRMRIGVQKATVYQALAYAFVLTQAVRNDERETPAVADIRTSTAISTPEVEARLAEMEKVVRSALCELPNIQSVTDLLLAGENEKTLPDKCVISPGIPVIPMLAKPTKGLGEVIERFSNCKFTCEFKYDGERAQIHLLEKGVIKVFSRNMESITNKYPDIVEIVNEAFAPDVSDCILDSEVVAYDAEADRILPFQVLTTRKRKDVDVATVQVKICLFVFDCMRHNGTVLLRKPLSERRQVLHQAVHEIPHKLYYAKHKEMDNIEDLDAYLQESIEGSCEGLMVKTLDENASYEPSKRSLNWLKVKKDYIEGSSIADSIDLVPIGAFYGKGKRSKTYGVFLLAVWNVEAETFQTVCKAGTGFSEDALQEHYTSLSARLLEHKKSYYQVDDKMVPDVWFEPCQVWECRAADLSISPVHTAAFGEKTPDKGIGLRFPRFLRIRPDKAPEDATSSQQIIDMYESQFSQGGGDRDGKTLAVEDEDMDEDMYEE